MVTVLEMVDYSGISRSKLYKFINDGSLISVKLGGRRFIRMDDANRFIRSLTGDQPSPDESGAPIPGGWTSFRGAVVALRDEFDFGAVNEAWAQCQSIKAACSTLEGDELDIVGLVIERLRHGRGIYGQWVASADLRDHDAETQDELVDAAIYTAMREIRKRRLAG